MPSFEYVPPFAGEPRYLRVGVAAHLDQRDDGAHVIGKAAHAVVNFILRIRRLWGIAAGLVAGERVVRHPLGG